MKHIFLHIPKTGGTTFANQLNEMYAGKRIFSLSRWKGMPVEKFIELPVSEKAKIDLLRGHMIFGLHSFFEPEKSLYMAFIRNPLDRMVSHYFHELRQSDHPLGMRLRAENISLGQYLTSDLNDHLDNGQTRQLAGVVDLPINACSEATLALAKSNVTNWFGVLGITERYDESILLMKAIFGWKKSPCYIKKNVGKKKRSEIHPEAVAYFNARNHFDLELFSWANQRLDSLIAQQPNWKIRLAAFKLLNRLYGVRIKMFNLYKRINDFKHRTLHGK